MGNGDLQQMKDDGLLGSDDVDDMGNNSNNNTKKNLEIEIDENADYYDLNQ